MTVAGRMDRLPVTGLHLACISLGTLPWRAMR